MKLAAISHLASASAPTGAEKSLARLVGELGCRGHERAVVVPGPWCLDETVRESGADVIEIANRGCWLVQAGEQPLWKQVLRYLRFRAPDPGYRRMMIWLDRFWPEVVHVNCLPQVKGAAAARALGLPVVWHIREILPPSRRRKWFARRLRRDAASIVAVSGAVASWLADEGLGEKVTVIHNGTASPPPLGDSSTLRAELGLPVTGTLVGFFAQIVEHKGVFDLLEAGNLAMERDASLGVVFAGAGPAVGRLHEAAAASPYASRITILPPQAEVWKLLGVVDMVAVPSLWSDPLPRTVMEAMAAAKPVVAYRTGGVPEMIEEGSTGFMVKPGDVAGLGSALERLASDPELRRRFGESGGLRARREFSLEAHVDRMERILLENVQNRGQSIKDEGAGDVHR